MSVASGPYIVNNGLIFDYDMKNTGRSWLGKPTTNTSSGFYSLGNGLTLTYVGTDNSGWQQYSISGSWSGSYPYSMIISSSTNFFGATSYSAQIQIKNSCPQKFAAWGAINYVNDPNMTSAGTSTITDYGSYQLWKRENFIYSTGYAGAGGTTQAGYLVTQPISGTTFNPSTDFVYVRNIQIEQNTFCTPYTPFSRSTTQALVDATNRSIATTGSLTYESDNTFSFTYSSPGYVSIPLATALNKTEGTMNFWLYPTRYNGGNGYFVNREDAIANAVDWMWIGPYSNTFYFRFGNGSDCCSNDLSFGSVSTTIPLNTWVNMCFTWKINGTSAIYKNGTLLTSRSIGNIPNTNPAANGRIGLGHDNADNYFNGSMPRVQIYNRQLSADEVVQNFNALRGVYGL